MPTVSINHFNQSLQPTTSTIKDEVKFMNKGEVMIRVKVRVTRDNYFDPSLKLTPFIERQWLFPPLSAFLCCSHTNTHARRRCLCVFLCLCPCDLLPTLSQFKAGFIFVLFKEI